MLYYAFICSRVRDGISAWGTVTKTKLHEIEIRLNHIVRTITWNKRFSHITHLHKKLGFLEVNDMYKLELAKIMHKLFNDKLPLIFQVVKTVQVYSDETRSVKKCYYFLPRVTKSACQNSLTFWGTKVWKEINKELRNKNFVIFKKQFKQFFLSNTKTRVATWKLKKGILNLNRAFLLIMFLKKFSALFFCLKKRGILTRKPKGYLVHQTLQLFYLLYVYSNLFFHVRALSNNNNKLNYYVVNSNWIERWKILFKSTLIREEFKLKS